MIALVGVALLWSTGGDNSTVFNVIFTVLMIVGSMVDNILKPIVLGRGLDVPMPVILIGALGGMMSGVFWECSLVPLFWPPVTSCLWDGSMQARLRMRPQTFKRDSKTDLTTARDRCLTSINVAGLSERSLRCRSILCVKMTTVEQSSDN